MMAIDPLLEAANYFFVDPRRIDLLGDSSGYSNSRFARVTDQQGQLWCLRGWADSTTEQMRFIHQVLLHSRMQGFTGLPRLAYAKTGETLLLLNNLWFDAQEWLAGGPLYRLETPDVRQRTPNVAWDFTTPERQAVTTALAAFHLSTATLQPLLKGTPLQTQIRLALEQLQSQEPITAALIYGGSDVEDQRLVVPWLNLLSILVNYLRLRIATGWEEHGADNVICHGDLWPDHVYFSKRLFRGFVDFGALTFTTPAIDLAQLILHFGGWQTYDEVLAVYTNDRPLSAQTVTMIPIAAAFDLITEGYWSLEQLKLERLPAHEKAAHWHNLRMLLSSVEALVEELS